MKKPHRQLLLAAGQVCDRNTCFHRIDFWNDCEACGGTSFAEKAIKYNDSLNSAYKEIAGTQQAVANAQVDTVKKFIQLS